MEQKELVDNELLDEIAKCLKVPSDAIKNFDEEVAVNIILSTFNDNASAVSNQPVFNQLDNLLNALNENRRLYEALIKEKDEKIVLLEKIIDNDMGFKK